MEIYQVGVMPTERMLLGPKSWARRIGECRSKYLNQIETDLRQGFSNPVLVFKTICTFHKINYCHVSGGSPSLVVMGGDSCSKGWEFESRYHRPIIWLIAKTVPYSAKCLTQFSEIRTTTTKGRISLKLTIKPKDKVNGMWSWPKHQYSNAFYWLAKLLAQLKI